MKRFLLAFLVALTMCFIVAANNFDAYVGFCKEEFKFEFCGIDDSIAPLRIPISQKYIEYQFASRYSMIGLRKKQYESLVRFESGCTDEKNYISGLCNLINEVELAFANKDSGPGYKANFLHLIKMVELSIARINESDSAIYVAPHDIDKLLPRKLFKHHGDIDSAIQRYAMMRDLLIIGGYVMKFKKTNGRIPLSVGEMNIAKEHEIETKYIEYITHGEAWQLIASSRKIDVKNIEFAKYVPLITGQPVRFWKFDYLIMLSSDFSKKRKDLYKGEILNERTPWACRMDGGQVTPWMPPGQGSLQQ